jgi:hypothetical protein
MGTDTSIQDSASKPAPYGNFIFSLICMTLAVAGGVFIIAAATAQGTPDAFDKLTKGSGWFVGMIGTGYWARHKWSEIMSIEADAMFRQKHRSFVMRAGVAICAVLVVAAAYGSYLGNRAGHSATLDSVTEQISALGVSGAPFKQRFIQTARRDTPTMPEYIQRCADLESALNGYEPTLRKMDNLLSETVGELKYLNADARYAKLTPMATVLQNVVRKDLESARAFRKEIDYARQLAALTSPEDRARFYKANIVPAKDEEEKIANDEVEILRAAKARGVNLPESMYHEAGVQ